jgi:hypothetical protein
MHHRRQAANITACVGLRQVAEQRAQQQQRKTRATTRGNDRSYRVLLCAHVNAGHHAPREHNDRLCLMMLLLPLLLLPLLLPLWLLALLA